MDFAMGNIDRGVTSALPIFVSHLLSAFLLVIHLIAFGTQLTAVLHAGSKTGRSFLKSKSVILFVDSLYAEAIEAEKSRAALSASTPNLNSILNYINSEAIFETDPSL
jgi:hypothetical protein